MNWLNVLLALFALTTGLVAAGYWYKASKVSVVPLFQKLGVMEPLGGDSMSWIVGINDALVESGRLNKVAARWTAVSVFLSGLASVAGALFQSVCS